VFKAMGLLEIMKQEVEAMRTWSWNLCIKVLVMEEGPEKVQWNS
jgi:hypothetical protein